MFEFIWSVWERLTRELAESSPLDFVVKVLAAILLLGLVQLVRKLTIAIWPVLRTWWLTKKRLLARIRHLQEGLDRGLGAVAKINHRTHESEGSGLWLIKPIQLPWSADQYRLKLIDSIPIWVFANSKGGVAKTTNAVNLAAHYAMRAQQSASPVRPVLFLDIDYQGSGSSMCATDAIRIPRATHDSQATELISGQTVPAALLNAPAAQGSDMVPDLPLRLVPAYYDLAQAENRLLIEWLFGKEPSDVRFPLARILHDPIVQNNFGRIIIDAPPRFTTACIQALCAATHVVIPTILDRLSGEAVGTFLGQLETLKKEGICPHLRYGGIVGYNPGRSQRQVGDAEDSIRDALRRHGLAETLYIDEVRLAHNPLVAECAGQSIAYARIGPAADVRPVREMFTRVAEAIEARAGDEAQNHNICN